MLEIDSVITNGFVAPDTIQYFTERGWTFICTVPAKPYHPYALDTDKLSFFSKYTEAPLIPDESPIAKSCCEKETDSDAKTECTD